MYWQPYPLLQHNSRLKNMPSLLLWYQTTTYLKPHAILRSHLDSFSLIQRVVFSSPLFTIFFYPVWYTLYLQNNFEQQTYRTLRKGRHNSQPRTSLFRQGFYMLTTSAKIMRRQVCRTATQPLPSIAQELLEWYFHQLLEPRIESIWHCLKSDNMLLGTASSPGRWMIDEFFHSAPMRWDYSAPPRPRPYVARQYSRKSEPSLFIGSKKFYSANHALGISAPRHARWEHYSSATFESQPCKSASRALR